jgi:D-xylono/L-arabinono-1,4-lactonase
MDLLVHPHCKLAENPLWDDRAGCLYWTDIDGGTLHRYGGGEHSVVYQGDKVGGFTLQEDGSLLLFRVTDIARLRVGAEAETLVEVREEGLKRFNDVIATPSGDVFAGTIGEDERSGGVYRVYANAVLEKLWDGTEIANGMGFSPDLRFFYWTDSTARGLYRFTYDETTQKLTGRELIYEAPDDEGTPDGLAMAEDGSFFSARYGGGALIHHAADGRKLAEIPVAAENVTSAGFGGGDLSTLYVTTAQGEQPEGGAVFSHLPKLKGRPEFRSKVRLSMP